MLSRVGCTTEEMPIFLFRNAHLKGDNIGLVARQCGSSMNGWRPYTTMSLFMSVITPSFTLVTGTDYDRRTVGCLCPQ